MDEFPESEQVMRVLSSALNVRKFKNSRNKAENMVNEVNAIYSRTMNKIIFDHILRTQEDAHRDMFAKLSTKLLGMENDLDDNGSTIKPMLLPFFKDQR